MRSAGFQEGDSGSSPQNRLELVREEAVGQGLLQASRPWRCCGPEALFSVGPAGDTGPGPAVAPAGGPDKGFHCVPAWVSGMSLPDQTERRREGAQGQQSVLLPVGLGRCFMRPHPG